MMSREILGFLGNIVAADGIVDQRQQREIAKIAAIFNSAGKYSLKQKVQGSWGLLRKIPGRLFSRKHSAKDN
jgi:hypothetical protein